ncbi:sulfotransferase [Thermoleophilia bacterium SCSIO 60948]|nr:sulfotransferase [Thermoleophilia bacterium SCSIO 60948]
MAHENAESGPVAEPGTRVIEDPENRGRGEGRAPDPAPVVFVGGTGRSGTHILARLLSKNVNYGLVPIECRFHADADGYPGLLAGEVSKQQFVERLRGYWWKGFRTDKMRGLHRYVPREVFDPAVDRFESAYDADPIAACRNLFFDLLWLEPQRDERMSGIIEQSCDTILQAETMLKLFPEARFIHAVRDGRDASASRVSQKRLLIYPRTRRQGLDWWEARLRGVDRGARLIPDDRLIEVELGSFLEPGQRKIELRRLLNFAGVSQGRRTKHFVRRRMSSGSANEERWRRGLSERKQAQIDARYREILDSLEADGVSSAPLLREALERSDERRAARARGEDPDAAEQDPDYEGELDGEDETVEEREREVGE